MMKNDEIMPSARRRDVEDLIHGLLHLSLCRTEKPALRTSGKSFQYLICVAVM